MAILPAVEGTDGMEQWPRARCPDGSRHTRQNGVTGTSDSGALGARPTRRPGHKDNTTKVPRTRTTSCWCDTQTGRCDRAYYEPGLGMETY